MIKFYGKTYRYKGKTIGVCATKDPEVFIIGYYEPFCKGFVRLIVPLLLGSDADELQEALDKYASVTGLVEVQS